MTEANTMPFEPIPMPEMPPLPEMPALPEMPRPPAAEAPKASAFEMPRPSLADLQRPTLPDMRPTLPDAPRLSSSSTELPRPSFSRISTPPAPPSIARKPRMVSEEKPNPFLPTGLAPEVPPAPPPAAMTQPAPAAEAGFPMSWLKPSRSKGVVLAGLGSLAFGAFGLNALVPVTAPNPHKVGSLTEAPAPPSPAPTLDKPLSALPKITEERPLAYAPIEEPPPAPAPVHGPKIDESKPDESRHATATHSPIVLVEGTTPAPVALPGVALPGVAPSAVPAIPPATTAEPLAVPALTAPAPLPSTPLPSVPLPSATASTGTLPPPALPAFEEKEKEKLVVPGLPIAEAPLPPVNPVQPMLPGGELKLVPQPELPRPTAEPNPLKLTEPLIPEPKPTEPKLTEPKPTEPKLTEQLPVPASPAPEAVPKLEPLPVGSSSIDKPASGKAPAVVADAKTDYDVDIHKLRAGDTYAAISEKYYGTPSYANALRSYNDNADLSRLKDVQVPPVYVIKKFGSGPARADTPKVIPAGVLQDPTRSGMVPAPPVEREIQWGTPGSRKSDKPDGGLNWR